MLNCRQATEKASALLDGELARSERWALRLHLMMCHHCRRYLRQLRLTLHIVRRLADTAEPTSERDVSALAQRLRNELKR